MPTRCRPSSRQLDEIEPSAPEANRKRRRGRRHVGVRPPLALQRRLRGADADNLTAKQPRQVEQVRALLDQLPAGLLTPGPPRGAGVASNHCPMSSCGGRVAQQDARPLDHVQVPPVVTTSNIKSAAGPEINGGSGVRLRRSNTSLRRLIDIFPGQRQSFGHSFAHGLRKSGKRKGLWTWTRMT